MTHKFEALIYAIIFTLWTIRLYYKLYDKKIRRYILSIGILIVFWMLIRMTKGVVETTLLKRISWYLYYIPLIFIPSIFYICSKSLPNNPAYEGHKFVNWEDANKTVIANNTKFEKDTTLYAKWEKIEEPKKNEPKREEPKKEEPKKEEKISLSLSNTLLHRNETNTSKATASTENVTGNVVYSVNNNCVSINSSTGGIIANNGSESCKNGGVVTVTATIPGGKTASANLTLEKDLSLTITAGSESKTIYSNGEFATPEPSFEIIPNIDIVSWWGKCFYYNNCKYTGSRATLTRAFRGNFEQEIRDTGEVKKNAVIITATTKAGQKLDYKVVKLAN